MASWVYGRRPVFETLQAGRRSIHKLWLAEGMGGEIVDQIVALARQRGVAMERAPRSRLDRMAPGHHQGVVAQVAETAYLDLDGFLAGVKDLQEVMLLALDEIQDPQNLGAILRNAGFFGVTAAIVPRWRSAPVSEAAVRTSSGAAEHVPLIRVRNLADAILQLKEAEFEVVGADAGGSPLWNYRRSARTVLVLGNEGQGLRRLVRERCDKLLGIPTRGPVASLNVGSAAAIFLYEFFRSR